MTYKGWSSLTPTGRDGEGARLDDGSRVGVVGGGPAGAFFAYFLLDMAERSGMQIEVEIYEPRDFSRPAPLGCNMCGGIISESLVQMLATEGINLPTSVVQRGIDSYMLHMDVGSVRIETPLQEKRIAAVYRGPGPRDVKERKWNSFDGHLLGLAVEKGAKVVSERVERIAAGSPLPTITTSGGAERSYDLVTISAGVNAHARKLLADLPLEYTPPKTTTTFITEYYLGEEEVGRFLGTSMHVFLLNIPRLDFAAIIPKGDYATVCMLGTGIDKALVRSFLDSPQVRGCFPPDWSPVTNSCQCAPLMNVGAAQKPYADRIVFIGDSGVTRLYKDGIGAAYRTAKAAAATAIFQGVSEGSFRRHFMPVCRSLTDDNRIGTLTFGVTREIQKRDFARRAVFRMVAREQGDRSRNPRMSRVLWDMFTGSASYREVFLRTLHPKFLWRLVCDLGASILPVGQRERRSA